MKIQLLSDLHLETEDFAPEPAPGAEMLLLGGDICARWDGYDRFRGWPVPVLAIPGNHEFDRREVREALPALRDRCASLGITLLERDALVLRDRAGDRVRFVGTVRWSDFDVFGDADRPRAVRAAVYYVQVMQAQCDGRPFDAEAVREEALACRQWLAGELERPSSDDARRDGGNAAGRESAGWDRTVAVTHYAPSLLSADPRYGRQPGTASFCNADDELLPLASTWIHGHVHCRHDYRVDHAHGSTRVVCNARGHGKRGESQGYDPLFTLDV